MRYGIATWNHRVPGEDLADLCERFVDMGFNAMSFLPAQLVHLGAAGRSALDAVLAGNDLLATVHGKCTLSVEDVQSVVDFLGRRLYTFTVDAQMVKDEPGSAFDAPRMAEVLGWIHDATQGTQCRFGVEDFPLDEGVARQHAASLDGLRRSARFGVLIDVGHMNLRMHRPGPFSGLPPEDCLERVPVPIVEVHLHDNAGDKDSHAHFGYGNVRFDAVARGLRWVGFEGVATIEIAPDFYGSTPRDARPQVQRSLEQWRETCRKYFAGADTFLGPL